MTERLTRKEIKRDEFVEALEASASWMERNARWLLIGTGVVALVALIGAGVFFWLESRAEAANQQLAEALEVYRAPVGDAAAEAEDDTPTFADEAARRQRARELFTALREDYGSSSAADVAAVFLAQIAMDEGDAESARELWQGFLEEHRDHVLAGEVRVNLIHLDREQGRSEEVVGDLENRLAAPAEERVLPADLILWELALTYEELGRQEDAESTYGRLAEEYPRSPYAQAARTRAPQQQGAAGAAGAANLGSPLG